MTETLRKQQWTQVGKRGDQAKADAGLAGATKVISATYEQPYVRHAPIGAFVAVADTKPDGSVTIWSQTSQSQGARAQIAHIMGVPVEKVVIRWAQGPGQYGRTTNGGDGPWPTPRLSRSWSETSAVSGRSRRTRGPASAAVADVKAGLDAQGNFALPQRLQALHENDARVGGIPAGALTPMPLVAASYNGIQTVCRMTRCRAC